MKNVPQNGQNEPLAASFEERPNQGVAPLTCVGNCLIIWIPAFAGMTQFLQLSGFVTTGSFTPTAVKEATRDGAPPIYLVDGDELAEKLKELALGVKTKLVERVSVDTAWFESLLRTTLCSMGHYAIRPRRTSKFKR